MGHGHKHGQDHGHEHGHEHAGEQEQPLQIEQLDAAGKSLSDAFRISFTILKVIMIVLVVAFLASGFRTVGPDERALVLRFGKIQGIGDEAILGPGPHWVFPYPIDELVRIPVEKNINLPVNTFWYKETRDDILGGGVRPRNYVPDQLDPVQEGYCLTGSLRAVPATAGTTATVPNVVAAGPRLLREGDGSDYNIVHTRWEVNYQITGVEQFFRNVYVQEAKPGEVYFTVMNQSITPMLRSLVEDAVVKATVHYTIDEVLHSTDTIRRRVQQLLQQKLDAIESGIRVVQVQLVEVTWPKQVDQAFQAFISASQTSGQAVTQARTYAETTLTRTAGQVGEAVYRALFDQSMNDEQRAALWAQVTGDVQDAVTRAQAYQTRVVERARVNAAYLADILPEYRLRPELVARDLYLTAIERVLENADEKWIIDKCNNVKEREVRVMITRDPSLKPKQNQSNAAMK